MLDAATVGTPTAANRYVGWPYTKHEVAVMDVDMSAALLVATREKADALGVPEDRRLYLSGWASAADPATVAERADMATSAAMAVAARYALRSAGVELGQIDAFDLYSCFPSSVRFACDALGLALDDPRGLTLTGGLPYAGGPASGYVTHSIAAAHERFAATSSVSSGNTRRQTDTSTSRRSRMAHCDSLRSPRCFCNRGSFALQSFSLTSPSLVCTWLPRPGK